MESGSVVEIYLFPSRWEPATVVEEAVAVAGAGLEGDRPRSEPRAIPLLSREVWQETTAELGADLAPQKRRANLLVTGLDLSQVVGCRLAVGDAELQVRGETTPCMNMEKVQPGLLQALVSYMRGGVFATVFRGGRIRTGDSITVWGE